VGKIERQYGDICTLTSVARLGLYVCFLAWVGLPVHAQDDWQFWKEENGIKVYKRATSSAFVEIKAEMLVASRLSAFIALLQDTEATPSWLANISEVNVISQPDAYHHIVHSVFKAPWPIRNRDLVTRSYYYQASDKTLYLEISNCADCLPTIKNTIRVNRMGSQWKLLPISPDWVLINYQGFVDPGGKIPIWFANIMALKATMETFQHLKLKIREKRYQFISVPGISQSGEAG
jgi:hypothetical protein